MIAVDTTVLIYACDQSEVRRQRGSGPHHDDARLRPAVAGCLRVPRRQSKAEHAGFHVSSGLGPADGVPRYLAPREPDRRHLSKSPGAAPDPQRVLLGRPHSGRVRRGRRRDPVLRGRARYQRPRLRSRGQSVRVTCRRGCNPQ